MDAVIAAYAFRQPSLSLDDLIRYLSPVVTLPTLGVDVLRQYLEAVLFSHPVTHARVTEAATTVNCWLAMVLREFGRIAETVPTHLLAQDIYTLWEAVDQVHAGCQLIQYVANHTAPA